MARGRQGRNGRAQWSAENRETDRDGSRSLGRSPEAVPLCPSGRGCGELQTPGWERLAVILIVFSQVLEAPALSAGEEFHDSV